MSAEKCSAASSAIEDVTLVLDVLKKLANVDMEVSIDSQNQLVVLPEYLLPPSSYTAEVLDGARNLLSIVRDNGGRQLDGVDIPLLPSGLVVLAEACENASISLKYCLLT